MKRQRKSWQTKLSGVHDWKVVDGGTRFPGTLLVPTPMQIDEIVREIPPGAVTVPSLLRKELAKRFGADNTCPLCTGIFLRIVAEAAEERRAMGDPQITPYWRVVDAKGNHNPKYPGGAQGQDALLEQEIRDLVHPS